VAVAAQAVVGEAQVELDTVLDFQL